MDMDSVIVGQHIASRKKPVRIVRSTNFFLYAPENKPQRRKRSVTSPAGASGVFLGRQTLALGHRFADFRRSATALRPAVPLFAPPAAKPARSDTAHRLEPKRWASVALAVLALAVSLSAAALLLPAKEPALPDLSLFQLPLEDVRHNTLLETIMAYDAEVDDLPSGVLPVTLDTFNYRVQPNDTLELIGRRYGIRVETLISLNTIRDVRRLQAGTIIKIPNLDGIVHTVRSGESLASLASRYGKTVYDLVDANDLSSQVLRTGQVLFIPGARMPSNELKQALGTLVVWPLRGIISSSFGYRNSPITGVRQMHSGIDIVGPVNTPVKAAMDGRVAETGFSAVYGNFVILSHPDGFQTLYAHLNRISVRTGTSISQGTAVGLLGSTGLSTGPHLHFGVYRNGRAVNPLTFLP